MLITIAIMGYPKTPKLFFSMGISGGHVPFPTPLMSIKVLYLSKNFYASQNRFLATPLVSRILIQASR